MAGENDVLEIRLSRIPLILLFFIGAFFLWIGLELALFHSLFPAFEVEESRKIVFYLFLFFAIGAGGAIAIQMLLYMIFSPVMFRASAEGISFATGFRYSLFTIPWKYVDSFGFGLEASKLIANREVMGGLQVTFTPSRDIPNMKATSIGVMYVNYCLTLSIAYMGVRSLKMKETLEAMKNRYQGGV